MYQNIAFGLIRLTLIALCLFGPVLLIPPRATAQDVLKRFTTNIATSLMQVVESGGDFNGDGVPDILTTGGSRGIGASIKAFSGATGEELWSLRRHDLLSISAPAAAIGDFDGDGYADAAVTIVVTFRSTNDPSGEIILISGRTGALLSAYTLGPSEVPPWVLEAADIDGDGTVELIASGDIRQGNDRVATVDIYDYDEDELYLHCWHYTGFLNASVEGLATMPDVDGDGIREVLFGIPSLPNGTIEEAGAVFRIFGGDCEAPALRLLNGQSARDRLGSSFSTVTDANGDGTPDVGVRWRNQLSLYSGTDLASLNKSIAPPAQITVEGPIVALPDMNKDGVPDFGAVATDSTKPSGLRAVFLSGQDNRILGNFSLKSFAPTKDRWRLQDDAAEIFPVPQPDITGDGTSEVAFYVRSIYEPSFGNQGTESYEADITTISGTCPRDAKIEFINPTDQSVTEAGTRPVFAKATACGLDLSGTFTLQVGNRTYEMYDNGQHGDEAEGDLIYTAMATLPVGQITLTVRANVTNSVPLFAEGSVTARAEYNYEVIAKDFEWIEPIGHDLHKFGSGSWYYKQLSISFPFNFYGTPLEEIYVHRRGVIVPTNIDHVVDSSIAFEPNERLPYADIPGRMIAVVWGYTNLVERTSLYSKVLGTVGNRRFVITMEEMEFQPTNGNTNEVSRIDYQVVLHEATGRITTSYKLISSSLPLNNQGLSVTMGVQAGPLLGVTFSHKMPVVTRPMTIEYVPGSGGDDGGGDDGGGDDGGGDSGGGNNGGDQGGGNGGDTGTGGNGGGSDTDNSGSNGGTGEINKVFGLRFSFTQGRKGAKVAFNVESSNPAATQAIGDCRFSLLAGEGANADATQYKNLGTISAGAPSRVIMLNRFSQPLLTPTRKKGKGARVVNNKLFLRAGAVCPTGGVDVTSPPVQVRTSKKRTALPSKRWMRQLAGALRGL